MRRGVEEVVTRVRCVCACRVVAERWWPERREESSREKERGPGHAAMADAVELEGRFSEHGGVEGGCITRGGEGRVYNPGWRCHDVAHMGQQALN